MQASSSPQRKKICTYDKEKRLKANHYKKLIKLQRKTAREEERDKTTARQTENNKMAIVSPHLSIIKCKWIKLTNQKT